MILRVIGIWLGVSIMRVGKFEYGERGGCFVWREEMEGWGRNLGVCGSEFVCWCIR